MNNKKSKGLIAVAVGLAITVGGVAVPANAAWNNGVVESNEAAYYYSANLTGALWDTDINTANYDIDGLPFPFNQARFIGSGAGSNQMIYNNAHSLWNNKVNTGRSYYSLDFAGKYDTITGYNWANLVNSLNNNRSFKWI